MAAAPLPRKTPDLPGPDPKKYAPVPHGLIDRLVASVSPACTCLVLLVFDRTTWKKQDTLGTNWCTTTEPELARTLRMSDAGVKKLLREAESCIRDDKGDRAKRQGVLQIEPTARGIKVRFCWEHIPKLRKLREPKKLPTKAERERRKVEARKAKLTCPVGQTCPVDEVYLDAVVTNILPAGVEIVRPEEPVTPVATSNGMRTDPATPVPTSALWSMLEEEIAAKLCKLPDNIVEEIAHNLSPATVDDLRLSVRHNFHRIKSYKFVAILARDCGQLATQRASATSAEADRLRRIQQQETAAYEARQAEQRRVYEHLRDHPQECTHCSGTGYVVLEDARTRAKRKIGCNCPAGHAWRRAQLMREFAEASGDAALTIARHILDHPACSDTDRAQVYKAFPVLQHAEAPMF
jgi:hypothetical protein